jgi:predicted O-methyltransferase YrrM
MVQNKPLHNFLFETDPDGFYSNLSCYCTPWIDVCVILHLIRRFKPSRFLEIGTHRGITTRTLAEKFPSMQIVTVDPGDQIAPSDRRRQQLPEYLSQDEIGECVSSHSNVTVLKRRFEDIQWAGQRFDMIFVDGDHGVPAVVRDSLISLSLVNAPGVVIWHDHNNEADVNVALEMLNLDGPIISIQDTWIAYHSTHAPA